MPAAHVTVSLRAISPGDTFDPSIEGIEPITTQGTPVPADQLRAVKAAAKANGLRLKVRGARRK